MGVWVCSCSLSTMRVRSVHKCALLSDVLYKCVPHVDACVAHTHTQHMTMCVCAGNAHVARKAWQKQQWHMNAGNCTRGTHMCIHCKRHMSTLCKPRQRPSTAPRNSTCVTLGSGNLQTATCKSPHPAAAHCNVQCPGNTPVSYLEAGTLVAFSYLGKTGAVLHVCLHLVLCQVFFSCAAAQT